MTEDYLLQEEGEGQFFDCSNDISSIADACSSSPLKNGLSRESRFINCLDESNINDCTNDRASEREPQNMFMKVDTMSSPPLELQVMQVSDEELKANEKLHPEFVRVMYACGVVQRTPLCRNDCLIPCCSTEYASTSCDESCMGRIKNLGDGTVVEVDELGKYGNFRIVRKVGPDQILTKSDFEKSSSSSSLGQEDYVSSNSRKSMGRTLGWLRKLGVSPHTLDWLAEVHSTTVSASCRSRITGAERIKVNSYKKQLKELSAVHKEQGFKAHDGAILTMKFSSDGQHLATGGEDGDVRVWHVMECKRKNEMDILGNDPSCIYFSVNDSSELTPLHLDKEKKPKFRTIRKTPGSVCAVIPPDAFQLSEEPLHKFHGHAGDILDLSWSSNKCLLSSSVDKTVRMWQVGSDACLKVFPHTDYVTCVQFSPIDADYFISGCIDGKIRIWKIPGCKVVDWMETREIVTAVCYYPDGKGAVVGTMAGNCRFYGTSDNCLQLDAMVSLKGKKKFPFSRITGFQFSPSNPHRLMVSSSDSQIRILDDAGVISTFKGIGNSGSQTYASFTADGQHIISAGQNSNVYMWSHSNHAASKHKHVKSTWSSERFISSNASIAIPWTGSHSKISLLPYHLKKNELTENNGVLSYVSDCPKKDNSPGDVTSHLSQTSCFFLSQEILAFLPKSPATWPEDKLPSTFAAAAALNNSHHKLLKFKCQNTSHSWGQVIVTAGLDGWIRSYQNYGLPQQI